MARDALMDRFVMGLTDTGWREHAVDTTQPVRTERGPRRALCGAFVVEYGDRFAMTDVGYLGRGHCGRCLDAVNRLVGA